MDVKFQRTSLISKIIVAVIILMTLLPLLWLTLLSFKTNNEILLEPFKLPEKVTFENYKNALETVPFLNMVKNSFIVIGIALPMELLLAIMAAYALSKNRAISRSIRERYRMYFTCGLIIPSCVMVFPIYAIMVKLNLWNTHWSLILTFIGWCAPLSILTLVDSFDGIPDSLEEAAVLDGCNFLQLLFKILLPLNKPALATLIILNFLGIWNDFLLSRIMINGTELQTISLAAMYFKGQYSTDFALMSAGVLILIVPQLMVYIVLQKFIISGSAAGAVKG